MFNFIYSLLGSVLGFFSKIMGGNFLFGLLLFAILIKLILLPFGIKQQKTSIRQAKMRPREMAIRNKYKGRDDRTTQQKMQNEIMEMYQQEGYNPMGGCLPLILSMVIVLLIYQVIIYPLQHVVGLNKDVVTALHTYLTSGADKGGLEVVLTGGYQEIAILKEMIARGADTVVSGFKTFCENYSTVTNDIVAYPFAENAAAFSNAVSEAFASGLPNFDIFGIQNFLAETPSWRALFTFPLTNMVWLVLIPILNFVSQFVMMKLTRKFSFQPLQADQQQQMGCTVTMMDYFMPAMIVFITFTVPAAVGIYWIFNNLLGMAQSFILYKAMPMPVFTEADYKAAEKALKSSGKNERLPKAVEGVRSNPNSLHTIDFEEEDYAVLPEYESVYDKPAEEREKNESAKNAEPNDKIGTAPLKKAKKENKNKK